MAIFDDKILKPIFVYKYKYRKHQPEIDYEGVLKEVQQFERDNIHNTSFHMTERNSSFLTSKSKTPKKTPAKSVINRKTAAAKKESDA